MLHGHTNCKVTCILPQRLNTLKTKCGNSTTTLHHAQAKAKQRTELGEFTSA